MKEQKLTIKEQDIDIRSKAVLLTTAHRAKGREFDTVFIYRAVDKKWGNNRTRELIKLPAEILLHTDVAHKEKNEDERRLFYVAMTRAKNNLFVTSSQSYNSEIKRTEDSETMFTQEIPEDCIEKIKIDEYESKIKEILTTLVAPIDKKGTSSDEKTFLSSVLDGFKLSPTALNTYLACPYKFKLNNLLRAPRAKNSALSFGTAIHKALEEFFKEYKKTQQIPDNGKLKKLFAIALEKEVLSEIERERLLNKGQKVLLEYFNYYQVQLTPPLDVERFFGYSWPKIFLGTVPLAGKVDRIDAIGAGEVKVVDYKTGRPKSRAEIEGRTAQSTGDYKRQLIFYRLLGDLDQRFKETIVEAELDFVEPDKTSGKFKKEKFVISQEEIEGLKETIKKAWADITALKFDRTDETNKYCSRCEWRFHCWPEGIPTKNEQLTLLAS